MARIAKYPGWRTMTAAQRYNAKYDRFWEDCKRRSPELFGDAPKPDSFGDTPTGEIDPADIAEGGDGAVYNI